MAGVAALLPGKARAAIADEPRFVLKPQSAKAALLGDPAKLTPVWAYEKRVPGPILRVLKNRKSSPRNTAVG